MRAKRASRVSWSSVLIMRGSEERVRPRVRPRRKAARVK